MAQVRDEFLSRMPKAKVVKQYPKKLSKIKTKSLLSGLGGRIFNKDETIDKR